MRAEIDNNIWQHLMKAAETFFTELAFTATPDEILVTQMTSDKSTQIGTKIPKELCSVYEVEKTIELCVNVDHIVKASKRLDCDTIGLMTVSNGNTLVISGSKGKHAQTFEVPLLVNTDKIVRTDKDYSRAKYQCEIRITPDGLKSILKDIGVVSGDMTQALVTVTDRGFSLSAFDGVTQRKATTDIQEGEELLSVVLAEGVTEVKAQYPVARLLAMSEVLIDKTITTLVRMGNDSLLLFEVPIGEVGRVFIATAPIKQRA